MPDIMMCNAASCDRSKECRRHKDSGTVPDPYRQTWWAREETDPTGINCRNFWRARGSEASNRTQQEGL